MKNKVYPKVSIITPSFNQGKFIEETIKSVLNQTYSNIQYIIVDGGSTDQTMDVIKKYQDKIDVVIHEKDNGQTDAINKGFKLADGELVGWINSDDLLYNDCIQAIVDLYNTHKDGAIYYHSMNDVIDENGHLIKTYQHIIPDKKHLVHENFNVIQQGSFYNRTLVEKVDYLDKSIYYSMDLELWLKLLDHGSIYCTRNKTFTGFRKYEGTKTCEGQEKFLRSNWQVVKKHGGKVYSKTFYKMYVWWSFKVKVKRLLGFTKN